MVGGELWKEIKIKFYCWRERYIYGFNLQSLTNMFLEGFNFQYSDRAIVRKTQFFALLEGWSKNLFFREEI